MRRCFALLVLAVVLLMTGCHRKNYITGYYTHQEYARIVPWAVAKPNGKFNRAYVDSLQYVKPFVVKAFVNNECHDTKRELPVFLALYPQMPVRDLQLIGIDSSKRDARGLTAKYSLRLTPTFIFERDGKELGRIEERTPRGRRMEQVIYEFVK